MPHAVPRSSLPLRRTLLGGAALVSIAAAANAQAGAPRPGPRAGAVPTPAAATALPPMDLELLANNLEARFKDRTVGYAIVVSYQDQEMETRAGGMARRAPDAPTRPMSVDERFNIASASKLITGAAVMHAIHRAQPVVGRGSLLDAPAYRYLPPEWTGGTGTDKITIRDLLSHYSGLRCESHTTWTELHRCWGAETVLDSERATWKYLNSNFGYLRLILPRIAAGPNGLVVNSPEGLSSAYQAYVRRHVLEPAGITGAECKPAANAPALAYQYPGGVGQAGGDFGDASLRCGANGWNLSARELARFGRTLFYTDRILPPAVLQQMRTGRLLAVEHATVKGSITRTGHTGYFPGANNPGQISTIVVGLSNEVSIAVIVNSQIATSPSGPGFDLGLDTQVYEVLMQML